jgi:hypothetical protein
MTGWPTGMLRLWPASTPRMAGSCPPGMEPKGSEALTDIGKYLVVHERQADGSTKIVDDIFNSNTPGG